MAAEVRLEPYEYVDCVSTAMRRFLSSETKGHNHASTYRRSYLKRLEEETVGACGERAFAKLFGIYWSSSVDTYHGTADVGKVFEVRSTRLSDGCLIVRGNDADERVFFLVTGEPPVMTVRGWILGSEAKQPRFVRDPNNYGRPSWFVPAAELNQI